MPIGEGPRDAATARHRGLARLLVAALLLAVVLAAGLSWQYERDAAERRERALARQAAATLENALAQSSAAFRGANGLVEVSGWVDPLAFASYGKGVLTQPGLSTLALVRVVPQSERPAIEAFIGRRLTVSTPSGDLVPAPATGEHYAVLAVEPDTAAERRIVGLDIAADPVRGPTARAARDAGEARLSAPLRLPPSGQPGFLVIAPLYQQAADRETLAGRRRALVGFLSAGFGSEEIGRLVLGAVPTDAAIRISDADTVIFGPPRAPAGSHRTEFTVGGRTWAIDVDDPAGTDLSTPAAVLFGGLALSAVVALLFVQAGRREEAQRAAREAAVAAERRTAGLQQLTAALSRSVTVDEVLDATAAHARELAGADAVAVAVVDAGGKVDVVRRGGHAESLQRERAIDEAAYRGAPVWPDGSGLGSVAALPLTVAGRSIGGIGLLFEQPTDFSADRRAYLLALAEQCAQALERARLYEVEHELSETLQRNLLPRTIPAVEGVDIAVRYEPAAAGMRVGGDWYEVVELPDGRVGVSVGDVVGHGPSAAAAMGQLRSALRAFAERGDSPARVLAQLSRFAEGVDAALGSTATYGVLDPATGTLAYASAGHPPPLLVHRTRGAEYLAGGRSVPLGVGLDRPYAQAETSLEAGDTLVLYSDGAVERQGTPIEEGLDRLATVAVSANGDPDAACELVLSSLHALGEPLDDVVLLAVTLVG